MRKLLIQACSGRKNQSIDLLPAFDLYDGVNYRVIKKFLRENPRAGYQLRIIILSAEYGLISSEKLIPTYDRKMNRVRAESLQLEIRDQWNTLPLDTRSAGNILVNAGGDYERALQLIDTRRWQRTRGGIGERMQQLKSWLNEPD